MKDLNTVMLAAGLAAGTAVGYVVHGVGIRHHWHEPVGAGFSAGVLTVAFLSVVIPLVVEEIQLRRCRTRTARAASTVRG